MSRHPIGVFDSGLGGLTIVREIRRRLPSESIVYFGDIARLPYGIKSKEQIRLFSLQNTHFLLRHKVRAVVIACNSSSSAAYHYLKAHFRVPVVDVIEPAAAEAVERTQTGRIGVIGTSATIESGAYEKAILRKDPALKIFTASCPLFVPLVEEGWTDKEIVLRAAQVYLHRLKKQKVDVLILGCTHYPLLKSAIQRVIGKRVQLIDSIGPTVQKLASFLKRSEVSYPARRGRRRGELKVFVSDKPRNFIKLGERFLGERLNHVKVVRNL